MSEPSDLGHVLVCQQVVELLSDYLEGSLPGDVRSHVDEHLAACEDCRAFLQQLGHTVAALGRLPDSRTLPPEVTRALVAEFSAFFG